MPEPSIKESAEAYGSRTMALCLAIERRNLMEVLHMCGSVIKKWLCYGFLLCIAFFSVQVYVVDLLALWVPTVDSSTLSQARRRTRSHPPTRLDPVARKISYRLRIRGNEEKICFWGLIFNIAKRKRLKRALFPSSSFLLQAVRLASFKRSYRTSHEPNYKTKRNIRLSNVNNRNLNSLS